MKGNDSLNHLRALSVDTSHTGHFAAVQLLDEISTRPEWLEDTQLALGQKMFIRHGVGCLSMVNAESFFFFLNLPPRVALSL